MRHFYLFTITILALALSFVMPTQMQAQTTWDGTADISWYDASQTSFDISTPEQLAGVAQLMSNQTTNFNGKTLNLTADIWLNNDGDSTNNWIPIGGYANATGEDTYSTSAYAFRGVFKGHGHTIYNMYCNKPSNFQAGLFGCVSYPCTIDSLVMINPVVKAAGMSGCLVGYTQNDGNVYISHCLFVNARVEATTGNNNGGIIGGNWKMQDGSNWTYITNCGLTGHIAGKYVGGIAGNGQKVNATNVYFAGTINPVMADNLAYGGILGHASTNKFSLTNCYCNQTATSYSSGRDGILMTSADMQTSAFADTLGSAFMADNGINNGYPIMSYMAGISPSTAEICYGESVMLTANGYDSYLWSNGATTASITVSPTSTTVYTVTGTTLSGATGTHSATVTVFPQAVITAEGVATPDGQVHGTVTPASSTVPCGSSQTVTLTITPDANWHIAMITVNGTMVRGEDPTDGPVVTYAIDPQGTMAEVKVFFSNVYTITASTILNDGTPLNVSGLVSPWGNNGANIATQGSDVTYTFNSTDRYHLMDVEIDNVPQGIVNSYTFYNVQGSHTLVATYGDCAPVTGLTVSQLAGTSAMISWADGSAGAAQDYVLEWRDTTMGNSWIAEPTITGTSYLLGGLSPLTSYEVRVKSNCSNGLEGGWVTKSFHTPCLVGGDVQIGNSTSTTCYLPSYNYYNYSFSEQIFTAAELGGAHTFTSISFQASSVNATSRNWDIYLMPTTATSLSSFVNVDATAKKVFSGNATISQGWFTIQFDSAYVYDGTSNLMLIVDDNTGSYVSANYYYCTDNPNGTSVRVYSDPTNYDPMNASSYSATTHNFRNNIIFGSPCDSTSTCASPNLMVAGVTESSVDITWVPGYSETSWNLEYKEASDSIWNTISGLTGNSYTITGLNANTVYDIRLQAFCGSDWRMVQARTDCGAITIPYSEDFEDGIISTSQDGYILCWSRLANSTSHWAYVASGSNAHGGTRYMDFHYTPDCYTMAITPTIDNSYPVSSLMAEFYARHNGASGVMEVGVISDVNDGTTFEVVDTLTFSATNTYEHFIVSFENYSGIGQNIAFRASGGNSVSFMMDDLLITEIPTCMHPNNLVSTGTGSDYITINWTEMGDATSWIVEYGPTGFTPGQGIGTTETATSHPYTIQNLTSGVSYDIYVQADCGSMTSDLVGPVTVVTGQFIMSNANDTLTTCGAVIYDNGGPNGDYSTYSNNILVLYPETPGSMMMLQGTCNVENSYDHLYIYDGVGTGGTQLGSFGNSNDQNVSVLSTTGPLTIHFTSDGSVQKWGFELFASCATCFPPSGIMASNITTNSADLSWSGISGEYIVEVTGPDTTVLAVYDTTATLSNLTASSTYRVVIYSVCGSDTSMASPSYTFMTSCGAITITEATPWTEDFEGYPGGGAQSFVCWSTPVTYVASNGTAPFVYCGHAPSCHSGTKSAEFKGSMNMLVLPEFTNDIHDLRLSFWATSTAPSYGTVEIGVITNVADTSTFEFVSLAGTPSGRGPNSATVGSFGNYMGPFDFNGVSATNGRIALRYTNASSPSDSWNLDDFTVQIAPNCPSPVKNSVTATNIGSYDADISWTDNDPTHTSWTIYYKESSDSVWYTAPASTNPTQLSGLNAETTYDVYVITDCTTSDLVPDATFTISFTTLPSCPAPTGLNVTNATPSSVTLAWTEHGPALEWEIEYGPANFTHGNGTTVIATTNPFDVTGLTAGNTYKFYVRGICSVGDTSAYSSSTTYMVPLCDAIDQCNYVFNLTDSWGDGWNGNAINIYSNGVQVATATISTGNSATITVPLCDNSALSLSWNTGSYSSETSFTVEDPFGNVIYTCTDGSTISGTFFNDTVSCTPPSCPKPQNLTATTSTTTSVTLSWMEMGSATGWEIEYGTPGFTHGSGTTEQATTNPFTVTGLTSGTEYQFYVRAVCSPTDMSDWSNPTTAATLCDAITVTSTTPYTENFDNVTGSLPTCWTNINDAGSTNWTVTSSFHGTVSSAHSGSKVMQFYQGGRNDVSSLESPVFDLSGLTNPTLTYWFTNQAWSSDQDELVVYYRTSPTDTWTTLATHNTSVSSWTLDSLSLPSPSATYQIKFKATSNYGYGINLDDITISDGNGSPSIVTPTVTTQAADNIGQTSATLHGTVTAGTETITAQGFQWKNTIGGSYTSVSATGSPMSYNLTGLTANTNYTFRAFATTASGTVYGNEMTFNTLNQQGETCEAPTNVAATNIGQTTADISWTQPGNSASSWDIQYKENGASGWNTVATSSNPHTLTGLTPETTYLLQVIAHCSNGQNSEPSTIITFTTLPDGINNYTLDNAVTVFPNPTTGIIQIKNAEWRMENVEVYDAYGKLLNVMSVNDHTATLNLSGYAKGTYFVRVTTDKGIVTKRVVKN